MKRRICALLLLSALTLLVTAGCKRALPPAEGKEAPDFTLQDLSGNKVALSSLRGKVVLLNFWATWCPPCREEIPSMVRLNQAMQGKPFQMLAVSIDQGGKEAVEAFFKKSGVTLPALLDPDGKISKEYGTTGVPETFLIDKKGIIVKKVIGAMDWSNEGVVSALDMIGKKK